MGGVGVLLPLRLAAALERAERHLGQPDVALASQADEPGGLDALGELPHWAALVFRARLVGGSGMCRDRLLACVDLWRL